MSDNDESKIEQIIDHEVLKSLKKKADRTQAAEKEANKARQELVKAGRVNQNQRQMIQNLSLVTLKMTALELERMSETNIILNSTEIIELSSAIPKENKKSFQELENQNRKLRRKLEGYKGLKAVKQEMEKLLEEKNKRICDLEAEKKNIQR